jgi:hypothetical protein
MKTGSEYDMGGFKEGIHWHINPAVNIEYISDNDKRENITYVKYTNKTTGEVTIYRNSDNPITDSVLSVNDQGQWIVLTAITAPHTTITPRLFISIRTCLPGLFQKKFHSLKR